MSDDQVAVLPPSPRTEAERRRAIIEIVEYADAEGADAEGIADALLDEADRWAGTLAEAREAALLTRQEALLAEAARWDGAAGRIEATSVGTKGQRMVAAEVLRTCAAEVRAALLDAGTSNLPVDLHQRSADPSPLAPPDSQELEKSSSTDASQPVKP